MPIARYRAATPIVCEVSRPRTGVRSGRRIDRLIAPKTVSAAALIAQKTATRPRSSMRTGHKTKTGQGDVQETPPRVGAVDRGRLVDLLVDGFEPGEQENHKKRDTGPYVDCHD